MIKQLSHISLILLLLVSTIGLTVSRHYCGNELREVSITATKPCCEIPHGCCHNESETLKITNDFSVSVFNIDFTSLSTLATHFLSFVFVAPTTDPFCLVKEFASPPPKTQTKLAYLQTYLL